MTEPELRPRRGSHRESRGLLVSVLPGLVAVGAVAALVGGVAVWRGDQDSDDVTTAVGAVSSPAAGAVASPAASAPAPPVSPPAVPPVPAPVTSSAPAPEPEPTTAPAPTPATATSPAPESPSPTPSPSRTPTPSPSSAPRRVPTDPPPANGGGLLTPPSVVVLNQTRIKGLAARMAADLRDDGWEVAVTGNFRGSVASTTVYYPPGLAEAARELADDVPGSQRTRPRFGNLSTTRLTVVLTSP